MSGIAIFWLSYLGGAVFYALWAHYLVWRDEKRAYLCSRKAYCGLVIQMVVWPVYLYRYRFAVWPFKKGNRPW